MTRTTLAHLPTTVVALLAALALATAVLLLTGLSVTGSDSAGATWNKVGGGSTKGATWN